MSHTLNEAFAHIRGLKDIKELRLTPNPDAGTAATSATTDGADSRSAFICPVTSAEMDGIRPFVVKYYF